jgi:nucleoid-associated protein YgaU
MGDDPGQDFKDAVYQWGKNHGFHVPKPGPPHPHPITPSLPGAKTYVVANGDYLSKIALKFYGNGNLWPKIYSANQAVIGGDPNLIFPGQTLIIP